MKTIWRERLINLSIAAVTVLVTLLLLEIVLQVYEHNRTSFSQLKQDDELIHHRYVENIDMTMTSYETGLPMHARTNSLGFSGDEPRLEKDDTAIRIVNLGDSFTAGFEVDFEKKYTQLLKEYLSNATGKEVESYNFGVSGQGNGHALATFKHYALPYKPDIVLLWFFEGNDFEENFTYEKEQTAREKAPLIKRILRKSELARLIVTKTAQIPFLAKFMRGTVLNQVGKDEISDELSLPLGLRLMYTDNKDNPKALQLTEQYIRELHGVVAENGGILYVGIIPRSFQVDITTLNNVLLEYPDLTKVSFDVTRPRFAIRNILQSLGIEYFDLTNEFRTQCTEGNSTNGCYLYNCESCHLSTEGHKIAAQNATEFLISRISLDN